MVYITGDTHRNFDSIETFCSEIETQKDDVLVILGDVGINYYGKTDDRALKRRLCELSITLLCIHGNHEQRPESIDTYGEKSWRGGMVYWEPDYPNLIFAKDGEIYELEGKRCIAIGGAYSIDKYTRIRTGRGWWSDEQPSEKIKSQVEQRLVKANWQVDVVFSHTCPYKYMPREALLFTKQIFVDNSTEKWLETIDDRLDYSIWYCGHFHIDKADRNMRFLSGRYVEMVYWAQLG